MKKSFYIFLLIIFCLFFPFISGCAGTAVTAEEYYLIGMAYFDLGKFEDAEKWLNRARSADRTMTASSYNLGRLAFERQRYEEASRYFESILRRDPDNVIALRAAAYTKIMIGDIEAADKHYSRLLALVPESADSGYNHALVLFAMGRYTESEEVLERYPDALHENKDNLLLYARTQAAQKKIEAIDNFSLWLSSHTDAKVRFEYAVVLESHELYARALEEFRKAFSDTSPASIDPKRSDVRFALARVLLIADGSNTEGITELQGAVADGFNDIAAVEELSRRVSGTNRDELRSIINNMRNTSASARTAPATANVSEPDLETDP
ncbi:MAG: tetratricopeptide repeat protein [Treponema sp.]|nr:tetratricopeptide repeat protein [Treponema sp.]